MQNFFYQALCGGAALHRSRIIHRDLKPQNILIDGKTVKIADFGLSRKYPTIKATMSKEIATLWYRAPEVILGITIFYTG
jgi:serine/threonine protein kinase